LCYPSDGDLEELHIYAIVRSRTKVLCLEIKDGKKISKNRAKKSLINGTAKNKTSQILQLLTAGHWCWKKNPFNKRTNKATTVVAKMRQFTALYTAESHCRGLVVLIFSLQFRFGRILVGF